MTELEGPPLSPVTVCPTESLFVQITVSPFLTVIDAGLKAKFWIVTLCVTDAEVGAGAGVGDGLGVGVGVGAGAGIGIGAIVGLVAGDGAGSGAGGFAVPYEGTLLAPFWLCINQKIPAPTKTTTTTMPIIIFLFIVVESYHIDVASMKTKRGLELFIKESEKNPFTAKDPNRSIIRISLLSLKIEI